MNARIVRIVAAPKTLAAVLALGVLIVAFPVSVAVGLPPWGPEKEERPAPPPLDDSRVFVRSPDQAPPLPPPEMGLVDGEGYIRVPNWDDRHLTPEEKKANPIVNPRWAPLARCLQARGVPAGTPPEKFGQADLESLIGRLNAGGPLVANEGGRLTVRHSRETDAYVSCATTTLQVFSEDLYKILTPAELKAAQAGGDAPEDSPPALAK